MTLQYDFPGTVQVDAPPESPISLKRLSENLFCFQDTCNVYLLRNGEEAVLIDFGDGGVLSELAAIGVSQITDILMTHHHRDQGQGLPRAVTAGARIWAPHVEQDLFRAVGAHWQAREVFNNYNVRQDRFSLLEPVPLAGTLQDYEQRRIGAFKFTVVPTPGHTPGSISLLAEIDGLRVAFTGDLIAAPGQVWSMSATQWTYNGAEGVAASIPSLLDLKSRAPDLLLPSHGDPIHAPGPAIDALVARFWQLLQHRHENPRLFSWLTEPYFPITPHLLRNRTSLANSYVLLSESSKALLIDFGYDFMTGAAAGADRASRRPWLYSLEALKGSFGVQAIDVVVPTHYHDDHVAGINLLREVEGTQAWVAENFADILERPARYDLPCLWYDPIRVDRVLPLEQPVHWEEYTLALYALPGHTQYAVAIAVEVDGERVLAVGDQYEGEKSQDWNYVYRNRFHFGDYQESAGRYRRARPSLILPGHAEPFWVKPGYLDSLEEQAALLERLHQELLAAPAGNGEVEAYIRPYQAQVQGGQPFELEVEVSHPCTGPETAILNLCLPAGWKSKQALACIPLTKQGGGTVKFQVIPPPGYTGRRARVAVDVTVGSRRYGQLAEALITVL